MDIDRRQQELAKLRSYIVDIDKETTLLLQNLQWDGKSLLRSTAMVSCQYEANHRMPPCSKEAHEKQCYLTQHGYSRDDVLLPDPVDPEADTIVKFSKQDIMRIINASASSDPSFKRTSLAEDAVGPEPLSVARLQLTYSADERRVLHDAVVATAPVLCDITDDLMVPGAGDARRSRPKHWAEILAEQRDMKRRRAKYRGAAGSANYSHTLRGLIKTQMELYAEARGIFIKTEYGSKNYVSLNSRPSDPEPSEELTTTSRVVVKQERITPDYDGGNGMRTEERSRGRDRRKERDEREPPSKRRRDYRASEASTYSNTHKDRSPIRDKYTSRERRRYHDYHSKRNHHQKDRRDAHRNRLDDNRKDRNDHESNSDRYGSRDRSSKYVRYYDSYRNDKYAGGSREHDKHDKRDKSKRGSGISIKREEHTSDSEGRREIRREPRYEDEVRIKQEVDDGY